ncbi:hypothetical protein SAMD00023353_1102360 [Rosellinia necatrix]|uniref:Uncharacterized protein n=1 Tax=Rosellinia necatrix TaxID=77044 RepID=A0A1S7UMW3_ROSNE|nr:hypothetical protein SAMD00023353_1102360 [Rosellinia necatrix]
MQVIIIIAAALALLNLAEAGLIAKAPRTAIPGSMTAATQLHMATSSTTSPPPLITTRPTTTTPEELPFVIATAAATHEPVVTADSHTPPLTTTTTTTTMLAPGFVGGELGGVGGGVKFVQTTYWTCVARPRETHCGWHEPILDTSAAAETRRADGAAALRASLIAACAALALVFGV